jgi:hypothetical protein
MIIDLMMHRFEFMMRFSKGDVLDCGVADCAQWRYPVPQDSITNPPFIKSITLLDCDEWINNLGLPFIRAYAENVPKSDKSFDTVIYGDILEHVYDPNIVLQEGKRLTRDRIIISVPNEWKWLKNSPYVLSFETREKHLERGGDLREIGFDSTIRHPSKACIDALDDTKFEHIHHKRFYNEETFTKLIKGNFESDKWEWHIYNLHYSGLNFVNLGAIVWRK